jgi:hypothetical protein
LIGGMRVVAHFAGFFFGRSVRHESGERLDLGVMTVGANLLHRSFERIAFLARCRCVASGAITFFKRRVLVAHDETRGIRSMWIVTCRATRADGIEPNVPLAQFRNISVTGLTERGRLLAQHVFVIAAVRVVTLHALPALQRRVDVALCEPVAHLNVAGSAEFFGRFHEQVGSVGGVGVVASRAFSARDGIVLIQIDGPRRGLSMTAFAEHTFFVTQEFVMSRGVRFMASAALSIQQRLVNPRFCNIIGEIVVALETYGLLIHGRHVLCGDNDEAGTQRGEEQEGAIRFHRLSPSCAGTWHEAQSPDSKGACCFARMR